MVERINTCIHVVVAPITGSPGRSIDVCLDNKERRVFSRNNGRELQSVKVDRGNDGGICFVDSTGKAVTNDRASEIFLREFFFDETVSLKQ